MASVTTLQVRLVRTLICMIPWLRQHVTRLEEHNRLLIEAATESARKLEENTRLLTDAATESARKLEENTRLLTDAATESARKLQEREAELTQALATMSQRVVRLTEHNRWLTEIAIDAATEINGGGAESSVVSEIFAHGMTRQLQEIDNNIQPSMNKQQVLVGINEVDSLARELPHQCHSSNNLRDGISGTGHDLVGGEQEPQYLPRKKHVLMVTSTVARGGCERQILATADGLVRQGYEIEIFCLAAPVGEVNFVEEFSQLGIKCRHAFEAADSMVRVNDGQDSQSLQKFSRLVDHLDVLTIGRALGRAIKEFRPEIVHCWSDFANVVGGIVSTNLCVPRVILAQRNVPAFRNIDGPEPYACREAYRLLARNSNVVMLNNSLAGLIGYTKWLDVPKDKIKVVYNGFMPKGFHIRQPRESENCRRHLGLCSDARQVGTVMRFAAEKDPILWVETAGAIAAARPNIYFLLAGYGELAEQVRHRIQSLGLAERFILPGALKDVGLVYGALDVFLMTSRFEGTPNVLIEAQAAGIPVVATNVGGTRETVLDGTTGIVVANRRPSSLASAVLQILDDPSWRKRVAIHGPAFVSKRFGHQRMIDETIAVYDSKVYLNRPFVSKLPFNGSSEAGAASRGAFSRTAATETTGIEEW
jgi:glycosyltransferase involved in cell wall biosynthesis